MSKGSDRIEEARRRYSASLGHGSPALERAFATVPREDFLPPPPWTIYGPFGAQSTRDAADLCVDALVAIDRAKGINNGQPSLHAEWIAAVDPQPGETVVHVGCGGGYYTAILAELAGEAGRVIAYEIEPEVAALARRSLASRANVEVRVASGASGALPPCDVIYVNAAASAPAQEWIAALRDGGRLIFPWTCSGDGEAAILVRKSGGVLSAASLSWVRFIGLAGLQPDKPLRIDAHLGAHRIRELVLRDARAPDETCVADFGWGWFSAP
jgi:protein-L-isoaspartate(D-aspartate) O-methyltransferase